MRLCTLHRPLRSLLPPCWAGFRALHIQPLLPSSAASAPLRASVDCYAQLEALWLRFEGPDALTRLRMAAEGQRSVVVIAGDQFTGKSTASSSLADALGGEVISGQLSHSPPSSSEDHRLSTLSLTGAAVALLCAVPREAGSVFRARATRMGISVPELSRRAGADPSIDAHIDYALATLAASGLASGKPLVMEGRQTAVMASYVRSTLHKPSIRRFYLHCSRYQQVLRFIEREAGGLQLAQEVQRLLPPNPGCRTMADYSTLIETLDIRSRICAGLVANSSRDADDHARYAQLYGSDERLDYRNRQLYDAVIDTTRNSPHDTFTQLSTALADTNSDSIAGTGA